MMNSNIEKREGIRTSALVSIVVCLHAMAVGGFIFIQGCGTSRGPIVVESPPPPVMPPLEQRSDPGKRSTPAFPVTGSARSTGAGSGHLGDVQTYVVQKGDVLSRIAKRHNVTSRELIELNKLENPNKIRIGQKFLLPPYAAATGRRSSTKPASVEHPSSSPRAIASGSTYIVQRGDSLSQIVRLYGVSVDALRQANGIRGDKILIGQKLNIPSGSVEASMPTSVTPEVKVSPPVRAPFAKEIEPVAETDTSLEFEQVKTAPSAAPAEPPLEQVFEHTVREGETLRSIAIDFAVLEEEIATLNNLDKNAPLTPGQKIKVPPMVP